LVTAFAAVAAAGAHLARGQDAGPTATPAVTADPQRCQESVANQRRALEIFAHDPAIELQLARALALCEQHEEAIARLRRYLGSRPDDAGALLDLGSELLRVAQGEAAVEALRQALRVEPKNDDARLGLARALAAAGNQAEALLRYDEVLAASPQNYDALQGRAFVLYHIGRFAEARAIFERLQPMNPSDSENSEALANVTRAENEARAAAERPPASALPEARLTYYQHRLAGDPRDKTTLLELGRAQAELKDFPAAVGTYRQALALDPGDREAKFQLTRVLGWDRQFDASITLYQELLNDSPDNAEWLEGLARVETWSGRLEDARRLYQRLAAKQASEAVELEIARLDFRLHYYHLASEAAAGVLSGHPANRDARLLGAQVELKLGHNEKAREGFAAILQGAPRDPEALFGKAAASYYGGHLDDAYAAAKTLLEGQPQNFDALMLLARIDRARGDRKAAMAEVAQCERISPNNPEAEALKDALWNEWPLTLHTSAAFAREISSAQAGASAPGAGEDLRTSAYGADFGFKMLPRTDSVLSLDALPSSSPSGAIRGAAAPGQFLYRQTTSVNRRLQVRGGIGLVRFGPGSDQNIPGQSEAIPSAGVRPIGLAGASVSLTPSISADLNWTRAAVTYTPTSVRLGVIDQRFDAALNLRMSPRTDFDLDYFRGTDSSEEYAHFQSIDAQATMGNIADRLRYSGATITFTGNLVRFRRFAFDGGYSGLMDEFVNVGGRSYLGFFTPRFYQRHLLTGRFSGKLWGPVSYDFSGGFGAQQIERGQPLTRAFTLSPSFTVRTTPRLTLGVGYTYYNFAQTLGELRGNAFRITTDWKF
jgi:tetratricopeptide (TPR) repeat protein